MSRHSRPNTPLRIALAVISVLLIVVLMAVTLIYRPSWLHADTPTVERSSVGRTGHPTAISRLPRDTPPSVRCSIHPSPRWEPT